MDGKTLAGWHKNGLGDWTVEDGAFVGRSNKAKLYGHLVSDEQFQDFTVRFQFQCTSGDSGFFIRTQMEEPDKTMACRSRSDPAAVGPVVSTRVTDAAGCSNRPRNKRAFCYREGAVERDDHRRQRPARHRACQRFQDRRFER